MTAAIETRRLIRAAIGIALCGAALPAFSAPPAALQAQAAAARAAAPALAWSAPIGASQLARDLGALIDNSARSGQWGVIVVSLSRGDTLFSRNADSPLVPASTMKVFTSALALDYLGPNHQFETLVLREGTVDNAGVLRGDLVLRGAGDPALALRGGVNPMRTLAREVASAGITSITGSVVGDGSAFDGRRVPDGWLQRYLGAAYAARVSALSFNQNLVSLTVRVVNGRAQVSLTPAVSGLAVANQVTVRADNSGAAVSLRQNPATGAFTVSGWIGARSPARSYSYVVENPELFAAAAFRAALEAEGVKVNGAVLARPAEPSASRVAGLASQPIADLVARMNGESNNHFAELLFRNAARSGGSVGSADTGNALLQSFLADKVGTPGLDVFAADGSGLSTLDRITPRSLVSVLDYSARASWAMVFAASLPVAGMTETLRSRMRGAPAQGRLRAKTGTTSEVTSLGGYVTTANGEDLVFAFIYNGADRTRARTAIDAMGSTLAAFSRF